MLLNFIEWQRLLHSFKTAIAISLAFLLTRFINLPSEWVLISIVVVMCGQIYVGGILQKSYLRLFGTCIGCLTASVAILFSNQSLLIIFITITLSSFIFSYLATRREDFGQMGTLAAVTTIIILFNPQPTFMLAIIRLIEISLGIIIAALISQFIFPIHARTYLLKAQSDALFKISEFYKTFIIEKLQIPTDENMHEQEEKIIQSIIRQRKLAKDSSTELIGKRYNTKNITQILSCEREIISAMQAMSTALNKIDCIDLLYEQKNKFTEFNDAVLATINQLIKVIEKKNNIIKSDIQFPKIDELIESISTINHSKQQTYYLSGLIFSAEILVNRLKKIASLILSS